MNVKALLVLTLSVTISLLGTTGFSGEAEITLKHATKPSGQATQKVQPSGTKEDGLLLPGIQESSVQETGADSKSVIQGSDTTKYQGLEPDEID